MYTLQVQYILVTYKAPNNNKKEHNNGCHKIKAHNVNKEFPAGVHS